MVLRRKDQVGAFHVIVAGLQRDRFGLRGGELEFGFGFGVRVHGQKSVAAGASVEVSGTDETGTLDVGSVCSDSGVAESLITRPFTYRTSRPGIAAMRSPGVMMP